MTIFCPPPFIKAPSGGGAGITMTAGTFAGATGYTNGSYFFPVTGSISAEPVVGQVLVALLVGGPANETAFDGDATAALTGLTVWVNGVEYPFDGDDWGYDGDFTIGSWVSSGPTLANGVAYSIEIK